MARAFTPPTLFLPGRAGEHEWIWELPVVRSIAGPLMACRLRNALSSRQPCRPPAWQVAPWRW
eukprot:5501650-Alexandrium_andersonii.AAC.1